MSALATAFATAGAQSAAEIAQERRITDVIGAVAIVLALRAQSEKRMLQLAEGPPRLLGLAIIAAIDSGATLDEATAAVIAAMEGD